jgi:hypothetical protein
LNFGVSWSNYLELVDKTRFVKPKKELTFLNKSVDQNYRITPRCGEEENPRSSSCMWAGRSDFLDFLVLFHQGKRTKRPTETTKKIREELQIVDYCKDQSFKNTGKMNPSIFLFDPIGKITFFSK